MSGRDESRSSSSRPDGSALPLPRRSFLGLAAVTALGLTTVGCGSDKGSASTAASNGTSTGNGDLQIAMQDIQFVPKVATAKVGQKVVWTNHDAVQHDVRALKGAKFQSSLFAHGETYAYTPTKVGTIEYDCSIHPGMDGVLRIVA